RGGIPRLLAAFGRGIVRIRRSDARQHVVEEADDPRRPANRGGAALSGRSRTRLRRPVIFGRRIIRRPDMFANEFSLRTPRTSTTSGRARQVLLLRRFVSPCVRQTGLGAGRLSPIVTSQERELRQPPRFHPRLTAKSMVHPK